MKKLSAEDFDKINKLLIAINDHVDIRDHFMDMKQHPDWRLYYDPFGKHHHESLSAPVLHARRKESGHCVTVSSKLGTPFEVNVTNFKRFAAGELQEIDSLWLILNFVTYAYDSDAWKLTPRGEDFLASADLIPHSFPDSDIVDIPESDKCQACGGSGERELFTSSHVCDVCKGSRKNKSRERFESSLSVGDEVIVRQEYRDKFNRGSIAAQGGRLKIIRIEGDRCDVGPNPLDYAYKWELISF